MKWQSVTESNRCEYIPPEGEVLTVSYATQGLSRELALFFITQNSIPVWRATSVNGQPTNKEEAKALLKKVYNIFNLPCWTMFERTLLIWPPAINDGDVLTVEIANAANQS